jgi:hypothetical protein
MGEREVGRSEIAEPGPMDAEGPVWRRIVERLVEDGEQLVDALRIADRLVRQRRRKATLPTGSAIETDDSPRSRA